MEISKVDRRLNEACDQLEQALEKPRKLTSDDIKNLRVEIKQAHRQINKDLQATAKPAIADKTIQRILKIISRLQDDTPSQVRVGAIETALFYETVRDLQNIVVTLRAFSREYKKVSKVEKTRNSKKQTK